MNIKARFEIKTDWLKLILTLAKVTGKKLHISHYYKPNFKDIFKPFEVGHPSEVKYDFCNLYIKIEDYEYGFESQYDVNGFNLIINGVSITYYNVELEDHLNWLKSAYQGTLYLPQEVNEEF